MEDIRNVKKKPLYQYLKDRNNRIILKRMLHKQDGSVRSGIVRSWLRWSVVKKVMNFRLPYKAMI
jgi:hypothetical protein